MYYQVDFDLENKGPREIARRACGEVRGLVERDLHMIAKRFSSDLRYTLLDEVAGRLAFDYEDYLHRVHCVRERSWDVLTGLSVKGAEMLKDCDPRRLGTPRNPRHRETILEQTQSAYPSLHKAFMALQAHIASDIEARNVATHQTFIWIALIVDENEAREINDYDFPLGGSDDQRGARKVLRTLLRAFVADRKREIDALADVAESFADAGHEACTR